MQVGIRLDLVVGTSTEHGAWMVLRVPSVDCAFVVLVHQQPLVSAVVARTHVALGAPQDEPAAQLLAVQVGVQLPSGHRGGRVNVSLWPPGPTTPDDPAAPAVLTSGDHTL